MKKPILVIEDDLDIREGIQQFLECEGFQVITAADGQEGLEKLKQIEKPCLILLDLFMPVMNGNQFLAALQKEHPHVLAHLPVVVVSAAGQQVDALKKAKEGAVEYIRKPIDLDGFLKTVQKYCC